MKNILTVSSAFFLIGICTYGKSEIPQQPKFKDFAHLLNRSPFTIKVNKVVKSTPKAPKKINYFLRGVTKLEDKWLAVVFDRNEPKQNIILKQGGSTKSGLKLVEVVQNKQNYKLTKVKIEAESEMLTIGYRMDELLSKPQPVKKTAPKGSRNKPKVNSGNAGLLPPIDQKQNNANEADLLPDDSAPKRLRPRLRNNK